MVTHFFTASAHTSPHRRTSGAWENFLPESAQGTAKPFAVPFAIYLFAMQTPRPQWVRRARPLARRRARTLRPLAVLIRLRNPCYLERWRFLGW